MTTNIESICWTASYKKSMKRLKFEKIPAPLFTLGLPHTINKTCASHEIILRRYNVGDVIERNGGKYIIERSHFGRPEQLQIRVLVPPAKRDTDLEKKTEQYLNELGFKEHDDYEKQYNVSRYWIDFAFIN